MPEAELVSTLESIGFHDVRVTHRYLPFEGTTKEAVTKKFGVIGISLHALKPNP